MKAWTIADDLFVVAVTTVAYSISGRTLDYVNAMRGAKHRAGDAGRYTSTPPTAMSYYDQPNSPGGMSTKRVTNRNTNRYSVTALFSMAAEQDVEVEDELGRGV